MYLGRPFRAALIVGCGWLCEGTADAALQATPLTPIDGKGVERGVVLVRCTTTSADISILSRGAVLDLDLPREDRDLVLTAAHGLPAERRAVLRRCRVLGEHGHAYRIEEVFRAAQDREDSRQDWAVLLVRHRLDGDVGRLPAARVSVEGLTSLATRQAPVRLLLRQADVHRGDCHLLSFGAKPPPDALMYSCRSAPGLSGSPILAGINGRMLVIGIHLGWGLQPAPDGRLRLVSMGHPIDAEIAAAITTATQRAQR